MPGAVMDLQGLTSVVVLFILCLGLFFASAKGGIGPGQDKAGHPSHMQTQVHPQLRAQFRAQNQTLYPAVLRQNVAVLRFTRQGQGD